MVWPCSHSMVSFVVVVVVVVGRWMVMKMLFGTLGMGSVK